MEIEVKESSFTHAMLIYIVSVTLGSLLECWWMMILDVD